tara:strand:+ start:236 stop:571 length:336 start_codon:yes stop_codon:yes gene_type:complete
MERYFYFGEDTVSTTGSSCLFPLSSFLGMTPAGAAITMMHFKARNNTSADDLVRVTHTGTTTKVFMTEMVKWMKANKKNPFLIVHDGESGSSIGNLPNNKKITSVAVTTVA